MNKVSSFHTFFQAKFFEYFLKTFLVSISVFTLLGNAASDIWLVVAVGFFLIYSTVNNEWDWAKARWFQIAFVFWVWVMCTSVLSQWPVHSLKESVVWIRFPLFAACLPFILGIYSGSRRIFIASLCLGLMFLAIVLGCEKLANPNSVRLYGTWQQNTKAGWYIIGFGLPMSLWALSKMTISPKETIWIVPFIAVLLGSVVITGEIYVTISFIFGLILFALFSRISPKILAILAIVGLLIPAMLFYLSADLGQRFSQSLLTRIPWMASSDYFAPWMRGIKAAELNPLLGIGANNHQLYCQSMPQIQTITGVGCFPHPHNLYIQVFSEAGVIGGLLFLTLVGSLIYQILDGGNLRGLPLPVIASLCLLITVLWPVSTYSHAFGQHKNFFTWFCIGWALYFSSAQRSR